MCSFTNIGSVQSVHEHATKYVAECQFEPTTAAATATNAAATVPNATTVHAGSYASKLSATTASKSIWTTKSVIHGSKSVPVKAIKI